MNDLEMAIGQYIIYRDIIEAKALNFQIYLAVTIGVYNVGFQKQLARLIVERNQVNVLIFDPNQEVLLEWIN
jgi:hypothetical protein